MHLVVLPLVIAAAGCKEAADEPEVVRPVRAIKIGELKAVDGREFPGRAKARNEVELSFQVAGPLVSLPVDVGTEVKQGDEIASIDPRDFQAALDTAEGNLARAQANLLAMERGARPEELAQLKAALEEAEATSQQAAAEFERYAEAIKTKAVSQSEYDFAKARSDRTVAQIKTAQEALNIGQTGARPEDLDAKRSEIRALEANVAAAKNQLDYALLKAPFSGRVAARYVDNFQTVQAKQSIVRLLDMTKIEVTIQVPESLIGLVPQVKKVSCRFDAIPDREFFGVVSKIGSEASAATRTYPVTVEIDQPEDVQIMPGMAATLRNQPVEDSQTTAAELLVPASAVFTDVDGKQSYVWVVDEAAGTVAKKPISTGQLTPAGLQISEGLSVGEWVVLTGTHSLLENQKVKILQEGDR